MNICLVTFLIFLIDEIACKSIPNRGKQQNGDPQKSVEAYDQRQSGKYNIHINVKDVQLIKLDDFKIGDDYSYGDYGDYGSDAEYDYDVSNLTTSPVWAHLGTDKPTTSTKKPKPTVAPSKPVKPVVASTENSEKITSSTSSPVISETSSIETPTINRIEENSSSSLISNESEDLKPDMHDKPDSTTKEPVAATTTTIKSTTVTQTQEPIDYEEIPVQVIYERRKHNNYGNQQKKGGNGGGRKRFNKRPSPSVQVIEPHALKHHKNVEIIDSIEPKLIDDDDYVMNICGHNEYLDNLGRCRTRRNQNKQGQ